MPVHANTDASTSSDWSSRMRRPALAVLALAVLALSGCGSSTQSFTGSLLLANAFGDGSDMDNGTFPCTGTGGFADISEGTVVTVYDATSAIVATGALGPSETMKGSGGCLFPFTIDEVPESDFYQVEVAKRGMVTFTQQQVAESRVSLTLGR